MKKFSHLLDRKDLLFATSRRPFQMNFREGSVGVHEQSFLKEILRIFLQNTDLNKIVRFNNKKMYSIRTRLSKFT